MTTRGQFLAVVRGELGDGGPNYVWSDGLLQGFLGDGLSRLSRDWPPLKEVVLTAVAGQRDYAMDPVANAVGPAGVVSVEYPAGYRLPNGDTAAQYVELFPVITNGSTWQPFAQGWEFLREMSGATPQLLRFRYPLVVVTGTANIVVRYWGLYTNPASDTAALDVAGPDEEVLKWAVCERALSWLEGQRSKRSGAATPGATGSAAYYAALYQQAITSRRSARGLRSSKVSFEF